MKPEFMYIGEVKEAINQPTGRKNKAQEVTYFAV